MPILINNINTPSTITKPQAWNFKFDTITHADYTTLLNDMLPQIDAMYGVGWRTLGTWEKAIKLRNFIRRWGDKGWLMNTPSYTGAPYTVEQVYIPEILAWEAAGNEGFCSWYSTIYMHLCLALGIQVRRVGWRTAAGGGDQVTEVFHPEWKKWVWMSPLFNRWYTDTTSNGVGLSTIQLHKHYHAGTLNQVIPQHDGYTLENPVVPGYTDYNTWILEHTYTIQMFNADGYRFSNGEWSKLTHTDISVHPLAGAFTENVSTDEIYWNFDVGVSKISAVVDNSLINLTVNDYFTPNFKHFEYVLKKENEIGDYETVNTTTTTSPSFSVNTTKTGGYTIDVYTVNNRDGKGTISTLDYTVSLEGKIILGKLKIWNGSEWKEEKARTWDGIEWKEETLVKIFS